MESKPKKGLIRIAGYEGKTELDRTGKAKGRGVYLCPDPECFKKAVKKKAISRNIGVEITNERMDGLMEELKEYAKEIEDKTTTEKGVL